jgi:type IX secretion system substrate protein
VIIKQVIKIISGFLKIQLLMKLLTLPVLIFIAVGFINSAFGQYAPPASQAGTTAIHADSSIFIDWANDCIAERGFVDISKPDLGPATFGEDSNGTGKADNGILSLGDGGTATISFETPVADGDGWDFAVFENSFSEDFLELAFVEVSSNGTDYHRFESASLTQQIIQIGTFGVSDARNINNLAGKYSANFGVPFDLSELKNTVGLDVSNIISIRIIDVTGSIDSEYASFDTEGRTINDPWPTPFESSGFDLDAVGVINNSDNTDIIETVKNQRGIVYPNPAKMFFRLKPDIDFERITLSTISGETVRDYELQSEDYFTIYSLPKGCYIVTVYSKNRVITDKLIIK